MTLLKLNYNIYNKELLGIMAVLKEQRIFLQGIIEPFVVKMDYKNLMSFLIIKELNRQQVRQAEIFLEYYFEIKHIKGTNNIKADVFS